MNLKMNLKMGSKLDSKMLRYEELTLEDISALDRERTIFLMAVSPLEVHGPHLPLGTDVFVSEALLEEYARELARHYPDYRLIRLPSVFQGANPLPEQGSINIRSSVLENLIYDTGNSLAELGFHYLFLADNHGGPGHQLALEAASRKLWRKKRFYLINPFNLVYRYMVCHEPEFMELTGLLPGACGDDPDNHAGTNETSLALAVNEKLAGKYREIEPSGTPIPRGFLRLLVRLGPIIGRLGSKYLAADLGHLARLLAWIGDEERKPYLGAPALASKEAGEAMLAARVEIGIGLFARALRGERVETRPLLWSLRFVRHFI